MRILEVFLKAVFFMIVIVFAVTVMVGIAIFQPEILIIALIIGILLLLTLREES